MHFMADALDNLSEDNMLSTTQSRPSETTQELLQEIQATFNGQFKSFSKNLANGFSALGKTLTEALHSNTRKCLRSAAVSKVQDE